MSNSFKTNIPGHDENNLHLDLEKEYETYQQNKNVEPSSVWKTAATASWHFNNV